MFFYTGCVVSKVALTADSPWFGWLQCLSHPSLLLTSDTNPLTHAFEAAMANEFEAQILVCAPGQLIPSGPGYTNSSFQLSDMIGPTPGSTVEPISQAFGSLRSHIWRDFGFMFIFIAAYIIIGALESEYRNVSASTVAILQFKKTRNAEKRGKKQVQDIENQRAQSLGTIFVEDEKKEAEGKKCISLFIGDSIFT